MSFKSRLDRIAAKLGRSSAGRWVLCRLQLPRHHGPQYYWDVDPDRPNKIDIPAYDERWQNADGSPRADRDPTGPTPYPLILPP